MIQVLKKLKNDDQAWSGLIRFVESAVSGRVPTIVLKVFLPWAIELIIENLAKLIPEHVVERVFEFIEDEVGEAGVLSDEAVDAYVDYLESKVDIPWIPGFIERVIFRLLVLLFSYAANTFLPIDQILTADDPEAEELRGHIIGEARNREAKLMGANDEDEAKGDQMNRARS